MKSPYEIYINYQLVDIPDDIEFPLNIQTFDVTTFGSISSDYSKSIKLPVTENNRRILEHADLPDSGTILPYRKLPVKVNKGGLEIISRGWCYIVDSDNEYYNITIFYGNYDFMIALENKSLNTLELADLDHDINWYNILHSTFEQWKFTKPYIYPLIEWGDGSLIIEDILETVPPYINPGNDINAERLLPVLQVSHILKQIILQAGFNYEDVDSLLTYFDNKYVNLTNLADDTTTEQIRQGEAIIENGELQTAAFHHVDLSFDVAPKPFPVYQNGDPMWNDFLVLQCKTITKEYHNQMQQSNMYYDVDIPKIIQDCISNLFQHHV